VHWITHAIAKPDGDSDSDCHRNCNCDSHSYTNSYGNDYSEADAYAKGISNAEAAAHTAATPVAVGLGSSYLGTREQKPREFPRVVLGSTRRWRVLFGSLPKSFSSARRLGFLTGCWAIVGKLPTTAS
jgi:hypothetical protein